MFSSVGDATCVYSETPLICSMLFSFPGCQVALLWSRPKSHNLPCIMSPLDTLHLNATVRLSFSSAGGYSLSHIATKAINVYIATSNRCSTSILEKKNVRRAVGEDLVKHPGKSMPVKTYQELSAGLHLFWGWQGCRIGSCLESTSLH